MAEYQSHLIEIWDRYRSNITIAFHPFDKRSVQVFQQHYARSLSQALVVACKYGRTPKPSTVSYHAESILWGLYWDWEECPFKSLELEHEIKELYDAPGLKDGGKAYSSKSPFERRLSKQTTNTTSALPTTHPAAQPVSNSDLLFSLMEPPTNVTAELPTTNSAPQTTSESLLPLAPKIANSKLPQKASTNSKHAHIMSLFLSPPSAAASHPSSTTPKPISRASAQSVMPQIPARIKNQELRAQIGLVILSKDPKAQPPQHGWAADGTPNGSVRLLAGNFAESYDKPDENDLVPKDVFERRTKGIFVLRAAIVQGTIYIWLEFAPQYARMKADWFWMQVWKQSNEFLTFLRDRQYKDDDGKWMMHAVDEEWMEWKEAKDEAGYVVQLDLTAVALNLDWMKARSTLRPVQYRTFARY